VDHGDGASVCDGVGAGRGLLRLVG
jgi:hypothetical protein